MLLLLIEKLRSLWFWFVTGLFILIFFGLNSDSIVLTFYFFTFLLPIIIGTSTYVNEVLIPKYLIRKKYFHFTFYGLYTIIISLYLQYLIIFGALYIFSLYNNERIIIETLNIGQLNLSLYLLIIANAFLHLYDIFQADKVELNQLKIKLNTRDSDHITIRYKRTNYPVQLDSILFIESLSDYIQITLKNDRLITKERISKFKNKLPSNFIRIHRSFIINGDYVKSYNKEIISIDDFDLPISRSYRKDVIATLATL
ncbi:MAG: LytTR family DNA-binding domain-containing protein [Saprospiraceae bacterium]|nr:LytTR family DNA-binding domain-containing protein [Saprospiraceae bacterium]